MIKKEYPYFYETHLHTSEGSKCGKASGKEMARAAKEFGYTGIFVTDHNWGGNTRVDKNLEWTQWVEESCKGYEEAKEWGDENGLDVFYGYEASYQGTDFLIYGVDKEWLKSNPQIHDASVSQQLEMIHQAGGMVIHAHPFREESYIAEIRLFPNDVDGVEICNASHSSHLSDSHNDPEFDTKAFAYAEQHKLLKTGGSDVHKTLMLGGGVAFKRRLRSVQDYIQAILSQEDYIICDGEHWYTKTGERYE